MKKKIGIWALVLCLFISITGCQSRQDSVSEHPDAEAEETVTTDISSSTPSEEESNEDLAEEPVSFAANGTWKGEASLGDGYRWVLRVALNEDGSASYQCGEYESEYVVDYRGTWKNASETNLILEMNDAYGSGPFYGEFTWNVTGDVLTMTHVSGDAFLYSARGQSLSFYRE